MGDDKKRGAEVQLFEDRAPAIRDEAHVTLRRGTEVLAHRAGGTDGRTTATDLDEGTGKLAYSIAGTPLQGEEGSLQAAGLVVRALNQLGARWGPPVDVSKAPGRLVDDVDAVATSGEARLKFQVTRADPTIWGPLARTGKVAREATPDELAEALVDAIRHKSDVLARDQRRDLVLVLDSADTPAFAFSRTVDAFRRTQGIWAKGLGFQGIWIAGPTLELVARLDE